MAGLTLLTMLNVEL